MFCINCGYGTEVSNSRPSKKTSSIWRRRACTNCYTVFSTREKPDLSLSVKVVDSSGSSEAFSEEKLLISLQSCFSHRKDAHIASRQLLDNILVKLLPIHANHIEKIRISALAYEILSRFDKSAAVFYKAHHPIK